MDNFILGWVCQYDKSEFVFHVSRTLDLRHATSAQIILNRGASTVNVPATIRVDDHQNLVVDIPNAVYPRDINVNIAVEITMDDTTVHRQPSVGYILTNIKA